MDDDKPLMTAAALAARLTVSTETVYRNCANRKWPFTKLGRVYRFTEEHYQIITATPAAPQKPRNQRQRIGSLLRSA